MTEKNRVLRPLSYEVGSPSLRKQEMDEDTHSTGLQRECCNHGGKVIAEKPSPTSKRANQPVIPYVIY